MARATTVLRATPPFRLDLTAWALRRREKSAVDRWDDGHYSRPGALPWPLWPRFSDSQASLGTDSSHSHKRGALSGSKQVLRASGILLPRVAADDSP
jgi:hypothetical protein